jgi:hypothetical protein
MPYKERPPAIQPGVLIYLFYLECNWRCYESYNSFPFLGMFLAAFTEIYCIHGSEIPLILKRVFNLQEPTGSSSGLRF